MCSRVSGVEDLLLANIAKDCWLFPLIEKGIPRITSCVLVHGYSSCDLGLLQLVYCFRSVYGSS